MKNGLYDAVQRRSGKECFSVDTLTRENNMEFVSKVTKFLDHFKLLNAFALLK